MRCKGGDFLQAGDELIFFPESDWLYLKFYLDFFSICL